MNLTERVKRLEALLFPEIEPPLIWIDVQDCSKDSTDEGQAFMSVVPGRIGGPQGFTLIRGEDEAPEEFLLRAESAHKDFYGD